MGGYTELKDPFRGTFNGLPILILGVLGDTRFLAVDSDGAALDLVITEAVLDVRYDFDKKEWVDVTDKAD